MRRLLSLLLIVVLLFGLVACGVDDKGTGGDSKGEPLIDSISNAIKNVFE
jgi:hypothetical protein